MSMKKFNEYLATRRILQCSDLSAQQKRVQQSSLKKTNMNVHSAALSEDCPQLISIQQMKQS